MTEPQFNPMISRVCAVVFALGQCCWAASLDRTAIGIHQDQLQSVILDCEETRTYDIDPAVAARAEPHSVREKIGFSRSETYHVNFSFLDGNVLVDRDISADTLAFWMQKRLPAIVRQIQSIAADGRVEELTTQQLVDGRQPSFGGIRQLTAFAPDATIDIALGLRLLGCRQWLSSDDFAAMEQIASADTNIVVLRSHDGTGHTHEFQFDKRVLYALVYYRCTSSHGESVEITNSDFRRYGNVFIPGEIIRVSNIPDSSGQVRHPLRFSISVKSASINDPDNVIARYSISWLPNMRLFDARTSEEIDIGPKPGPLTDDDIHRQLAEKAAYRLALETTTIQRINNALQNSPSTRP
jgi:hypothetical protein